MSSSTRSTTIPPQEFMCPLSHQLMTDPVVSIHGETFQRDAILTWLEMDNDCCPFSGKPMSLKDIVPHYSLRTKIQLWAAQNGLSEQDGNSDSSSSYDLDDDESGYLRKLGISEQIEIDTNEFKNQSCVNDDEVPMGEIFITSSTKNKLNRFKSFRSVFKNLGSGSV